MSAPTNPKRIPRAEEQDSSNLSGGLDGVTIMRYAHIKRQRTSGGVEQYLRHLDRGLLQRHRLTILQMHLADGDSDDSIDIEKVGLGRIFWIPVPFRETNTLLADLPKRIAYVYRRSRHLRRCEGKGRFSETMFFMHSLLRHHCGHLRNRTAILSDQLLDLLQSQHIDLLAVHWMTYDTNALLSQAFTNRVPFVFINHFDNTRWSLPLIRKWIPKAAGIGAVSESNIPADLRSHCVNLSDAIDVEFFDPRKAQPLGLAGRKIVLLPARIQRGKGHHDLLNAARIVIQKGNINPIVCFIGAVDCEPLFQELQREASATGLGETVFFLGEKSAEELRDWYEASSMVVLPSASEGLPRVLLEAQAMKKPVLAYDAGGVRDAMLPGKTGFLVRTGNVEGMAERIKFLIEHEREGQLLGERGRDFVSRQFGIVGLIQRHEGFYYSALGRDEGLSEIVTEPAISIT